MLLYPILGTRWQDNVSKEEVLKGASLPSIESNLLQVQLRWAGHVNRVEDARMPKAVFFIELQKESAIVMLPPPKKKKKKTVTKIS